MYFRAQRKTILSHGLIGAGLSMALFMVLAYLDQNPLNKGKYFDFFLMLLILVSGLRYYRDVENGGDMKFLQGIGIGLGISLMVGILTASFLWVFLVKIHPDALDQFKASGIQYLEEHRPDVLMDIDQDTLDKTILEIKSISIRDLVVDDILRKLIIGLFLSTILSVFLRKKSSDYGPA